MGIVRNNNRALKCIFDVVVRDGMFNYRGARIPLPSNFKIDAWRSMLRGYHDAIIAEYIEFGWPIGIDRFAPLQSEGKNHASAAAFPQDVEHYIATELGHAALLGPFAGPPTNTCHYSPLMTRPKRDSRFRRVIIDLSWPKGYSMNDGISRTEYIDGPLMINLPTHDDMERAVIRAGRGSYLYETDLSRGYRQLRVDPIDWPFLAFRHTSGHFMDIWGGGGWKIPNPKHRRPCRPCRMSWTPWGWYRQRTKFASPPKPWYGWASFSTPSVCPWPFRELNSRRSWCAWGHGGKNQGDQEGTSIPPRST